MASPPTWSLVLTDIRGVVIGELVGATGVTVSLPLNRLPTLNFQLPLWNPYANSIITTDTMVKAYRRDPDNGTQRLVYVGITLGVDESGDANQQSIMVSTVGPFWRLTKRVIGLTKEGTAFNSGYTTDVPPQPIARSLGQIAHDVVTAANGRGYTGIETTSAPVGTPGQLINGGPVAGDPPVGMAQGSVGPWFLKNAAEAVAELGVGINSFDYAVYPVEPADVGKGLPQIGYLYVIDYLGANKPNAIFEYGTPRANVTSYTRASTRDSYLNRAIVPATSWPSTTKELRILEDASLINATTGIGLYEEVVSDGGVDDDGLRDQIGNEHLKYRKTPRVIVTFTVVSNTNPVLFRDFNVGDSIRARAEVRGIMRFDSMFRIWGVTITLDQNGNESLDLQLVQE